jgi:hypothetical protein
MLQVQNARRAQRAQTPRIVNLRIYPMNPGAASSPTGPGKAAGKTSIQRGTGGETRRAARPNCPNRKSANQPYRPRRRIVADRPRRRRRQNLHTTWHGGASHRPGRRSGRRHRQKHPAPRHSAARRKAVPVRLLDRTAANNQAVPKLAAQLAPTADRPAMMPIATASQTGPNWRPAVIAAQASPPAALRPPPGSPAPSEHRAPVPCDRPAKSPVSSTARRRPARRRPGRQRSTTTQPAVRERQWSRRPVRGDLG